MTMHLFGTILTARGVSANNRGENEGNITTLQKIIRNGEVFTTVSSEAIRYAIRELWLQESEPLNRQVSHQGSEWKDKDFKKPATYLDDDVLGFMNPKKETSSRRGILEITRAVSTTPWLGTLSHNFAAPGSNPSLSHKNPIPYQAEIHDTRYQYSFALTPDSLLKDPLERTEKTLRAIQNLCRVGGNHARYLYDFSPEVLILRWTPDPAPRMLYCMTEDDYGKVDLKRLLHRLEGEEPDIRPDELVVGTALPELAGLGQLRERQVTVFNGVKAAVNEMLRRVKSDLNT